MKKILYVIIFLIGLVCGSLFMQFGNHCEDKADHYNSLYTLAHKNDTVKRLLGQMERLPPLDSGFNNLAENVEWLIDTKELLGQVAYILMLAVYELHAIFNDSFAPEDPITIQDVYKALQRNGYYDLVNQADSIIDAIHH